MKYKLINQTTKEETICEKIEIDGFNYYVTGDKITIKNKYFIHPFYKNSIKMGYEIRPNSYIYFEGYGYDFSDCKLPIATSNPSLDIPKVIDEVEELSLQHEKMCDELDTLSSRMSYEEGHNQSQQTHPFKESDMIEFGKLCIKQFALFQNRDDNYTQRLLPDWKEQQVKTIYYN